MGRSAKNGGLWLAGCYTGRELDYYQADLTTIVYEFELRRRDQKRIAYDANGARVPAPLLKPGRMAFFRDLMAGREQESTLLWDPRAMLIQSVEYSRDGVVLKGADATGLARTIALEMALSPL